MKLVACGVVALAIGCGGKGDAPAAAGSGSGSASHAVVAASGSGSGSGSGAAVAATRSPKLDAARCGEPCLFLLDTPVAQLPDTYKAKCAGMVTKDLGFFDCKQLDYARNCIYAAHGLVSKKRSWQKLFASKAWYEPHPEVDAKAIAMSDVERANVHELYERGKACKKNLSISGADFDRIKAWFAALPKPPVPKTAFHWENNDGDPKPDYTPVAGKDFVTWFVAAAPNAKTKFASGKELSASYQDAATFGANKQLVGALHVADPSKLRSIELDIELAHGTEDEPFTESVELQFIYDDKDQLVAIAGEHSAID